MLDGFLALADEWIARATDPDGLAWFRDALELEKLYVRLADEDIAWRDLA